MKVYFSSSIRAKKFYKKNFEKIYQTIEKLGYKNTSDFVLKSNPKEFYTRTAAGFDKFYKKMASQIKKADVCVFEVSLHSLGIGYSVNLALDMDKPVILLHLPDCKPTFFAGLQKGKLQIYRYTINNVEEVLEDALEEAKQMIDIRFTFFITPKINHFLNWIAKNKKTPRAVYLRGLLEQAMKIENFKH